MTLRIYATSLGIRELIQKQIENHRWTDSGFDIPMIAQTVDLSREGWPFSLGIHVSAVDASGTHVPCLLLPRSSIYKSPFRLSNSIGLIDAGYRGEVKAYVDNIVPDDATIELEGGTRLFQICQHNLLPWRSIELVDEIPEASDTRGSGGFGSTGLQTEYHSRT
jgi:dUTP pyrophosphatase